MDSKHWYAFSAGIVACFLIFTLMVWAYEVGEKKTCTEVRGSLDPGSGHCTLREVKP